MKKVFIGIQDGYSDGEFEWGLHATLLEKNKTGGYRPYWIAEILEEDWISWKAFLSTTSNAVYTGRNLAQWEQFWDSFTYGPIMSKEEFQEWKTKHDY